MFSIPKFGADSLKWQREAYANTEAGKIAREPERSDAVVAESLDYAAAQRSPAVYLGSLKNLGAIWGKLSGQAREQFTAAVTAKLNVSKLLQGFDAQNRQG